jgi:hypothetical protein
MFFRISDGKCRGIYREKGNQAGKILLSGCLGLPVSIDYKHRLPKVVVNRPVKM